MWIEFASECGANQHSKLGWSFYDEIQQLFPRHDSYNHCGCNDQELIGKGKSKFSTLDIAHFCITCSEQSFPNNMETDVAPKRDGYVYKRRKMQKSIVALLSEENEQEKKTLDPNSPLCFEEHQALLQKGEDDSFTVLHEGDPSISFHKDKTDPISARPQVIGVEDDLSIVLALEAVQSHRSKGWSVSKQKYSDASDGVRASSSSRTNIENGDSTSSYTVLAKSDEKSKSTKEFCITVLTNHGLLGRQGSSSECASLEVLGDGNSKSFISCKVCGIAENPLKMLICDLCEEAFHLSCCNPKVKKPPSDEWYCQSCFSKRPEHLCDYGCQKSLTDMVSKCGGIIPFTLRDTRPYRSPVRIGGDFQAEVPEWSGPLYDDCDDYYKEPKPLDPIECSRLNGWDYWKPTKQRSIGNWIQCQEVIYKDDNDDKGTICGKWRRAPLSVVQTEDWDCSCAILWDPVHADCAVPQELETAEVLKHLKYIEALRSRVVSMQQKSTDVRVDGNRPITIT